MHQPLAPRASSDSRRRGVQTSPRRAVAQARALNEYHVELVIMVMPKPQAEAQARVPVFKFKLVSYGARLAAR